MCEQCCTDAISFHNVLEGWTMIQARRDSGHMMKAKQFGLLRCNDPDIVWDECPEPDPTDGIPDEEVTDEQHDLWNKWMKKVQTFHTNLKMEPSVAHELVEAAIKAGYKKDESGYFSMWLFNHLGKIVKTKQPAHHSGSPLPFYDPDYRDENPSYATSTTILS